MEQRSCWGGWQLFIYVALDNHIKTKFLWMFISLYSIICNIVFVWLDLHSLQSRLKFLIVHLQEERIKLCKLCITWWWDLPGGSDCWRFQRWWCRARWAPGSACSRTSRGGRDQRPPSCCNRNRVCKRAGPARARFLCDPSARHWNRTASRICHRSRAECDASYVILGGVPLKMIFHKYHSQTGGYLCGDSRGLWSSENEVQTLLHNVGRSDLWSSGESPSCAPSTYFQGQISCHIDHTAMSFLRVDFSYGWF